MTAWVVWCTTFYPNGEAIISPLGRLRTFKAGISRPASRLETGGQTIVHPGRNNVARWK